MNQVTTKLLDADQSKLVPALGKLMCHFVLYTSAQRHGMLLPSAQQPTAPPS